MDKDKREMELLDEAFRSFGYPKDFLADYDQMECYSSHKGRETFLVRRKSDGEMAVAKCYDRETFPVVPAGMDVTQTLDDPGLPRYLGRYENERYVCIIREYVPGVSLAEYVRDHAMTQRGIVDLCIRLCEILSYLHSRPQPIIHRDVKPENVILGEDGGVRLIDFDIARSYKADADSDTMIFGTRGYAPPEQYGFAQTDARTDIYSLGVLLRFLLTGSVRENQNIRIYRPLARIIQKCTSLAPEKRYPDVNALRRALRAANPKTQLLRGGAAALGALALCAALTFAGIRIYRAVTYTPFSKDTIPAFLSDEDRIMDAVAYLKERYDTELFDQTDDIATVGLLRSVMIELYGMDREYVYGINTEMPQESDAFFLPWGWDDGQTLDRDVAIYAAVKAHDPAIVADWSSLKDDNGFYPGVRVAVAFAEEMGITAGVNRPLDISVGDLALILANTDRVFASTNT